VPHHLVEPSALNLLASPAPDIQDCCILRREPVEASVAGEDLPKCSENLDFGTDCERENRVSLNRRKASCQLMEVINDLKAIVEEVSAEGCPELLVHNAEQALRLLTETHAMVNSGIENLPKGNAVPEKKVRHLKTERGKQKQAEIVKFIINRVQSEGFIVPVSTKEIIANTSLRSKSHVSKVVSELIRDGKLVSHQRVGYGGYLPTQKLLKETTQKKTASLTP